VVSYTATSKPGDRRSSLADVRSLLEQCDLSGVIVVMLRDSQEHDQRVVVLAWDHLFKSFGRQLSHTIDQLLVRSVKLLQGRGPIRGILRWKLRPVLGIGWQDRRGGRQPF